MKIRALVLAVVLFPATAGAETQQLSRLNINNILTGKNCAVTNTDNRKLVFVCGNYEEFRKSYRNQLMKFVPQYNFGAISSYQRDDGYTRYEVPMSLKK